MKTSRGEIVWNNYKKNVEIIEFPQSKPFNQKFWEANYI